MNQENKEAMILVGKIISLSITIQKLGLSDEIEKIRDYSKQLNEQASRYGTIGFLGSTYNPETSKRMYAEMNAMNALAEFIHFNKQVTELRQKEQDYLDARKKIDNLFFR